MSLKSTLRILLFLLNLHVVHAQSVSSFHYSTEDGLPSSEVYFSLKDSKHFMWFATDRGLVRFDGKQFETFTTNDGLPSNVIFHLQEDTQGRIWFDTYQGNLGYFENNQFHTYRYNHKIKERYNTPTINDFYVNDEKSVFISMDKIGLIKIDSAGVLTEKTERNIMFIEEVGNDRHIFGSASNGGQYFSLSLKNRSKKSLHSFVNFWLGSQHISTLNPYLNSAVYIKEKRKYLFSIKNVLFSVDTTGVRVERTFEFDILDLKFKDQRTYIGFYKNGLEIYEKGDYSHPTLSFASRYSVSNILLNQPEIWVTTLDNGIYFIPNEYTHCYSGQNGLPSDYVTALGASDNELVIGDALGNVTVYDGDFHNYQTGDVMVIGKVLHDEKNDHFVVSGPALYRYKANELKRYNIGHQLDFRIKNDEILLYTHPTKILKPSLFNTYDFRFITDDENDYSFIKNQRRIISTFIDYNDSIYMGSIEGLFVERGTSLFNLGAYDERLKARVVQLDALNNTMLLATRGEGLVFYREDTVFNVKSKDGLISDQLTCLHVDQQNRIWVGSSSGVSVIDRRSIHNFDVSDGITSNEITSITSNKDYIFFGTKKGLSIIKNVPFETKLRDIPIIGKSVLTNDSLYTELPNNSIQFGTENTFCEISFIGISYLKSQKVSYRYQLYTDQPTPTGWLYTTNNKIVFSSIQSGTYTLIVQASVDGKNWSNQPLKIEFDVAFPFWSNSKVILTSVLGSIILIWILTTIYIRRVKRKEENKRKLHTLRMESLNAQMNPHFLFNSLNSIQNYILKNDKKAANEYVSSFAKLMRVTLKRSQELDIRLNEELRALELYLELEQRRSKYGINADIKIDPQLDTTSVIIPALLIQPLVENAIWHGLIPKQQDGNIMISITKKLQQLYFVIEDDGVGRDLKKQKKGEDISRGTNLTIERISLFSEKHRAKFGFEIEDLVQGTTKAGTRVTFNIPYVHK